jgi:5'(3')-deoxyribonucleotidase
MENKKEDLSKLDFTKGLRFNEGKIRYELIPENALKEWAKVLTYGANKYTIKDDNTGEILNDGANNWRKGLPWKDVLSSLKRHIQDYESGIDDDDESQLKHLGHAMCNIGFLLEYYKIYPEGDNRNHHYLNKKKIGLDIDGVLADFSGRFIEEAKKHNVYSKDYTFTQSHWEFPYEWGSIWNKIKDNEAFWLTIKPLVPSNELPFEPECYVTARNIPTEWTEKWLSLNGFPCKPVYSTNYGSKVKKIKELKLDIFVDDCWDNFKELNQNGICCYLFEAEYNKKYEVGYKRIKNLNELL